MINPKLEDLGRAVVYQAGHPGAPREDGIITDYNDKCIFVRYQKQHPGASGQATSREDLDWLSGGDK